MVGQCHKSFKISIKSWINFEKVHKVIKLNQNAWLKPCFDMNTELKKAKNDVQKDFFLS